MQQAKGFEGWAIVELFGHTKMAGLLKEATLGGGAFLQLDVPAVGDNPAFTRFLGPAAIYAINPVTEEIARAEVARLRYAPVYVYDLRQQLQLPAPDRITTEPAEVPEYCDGCGSQLAESGGCPLCSDVDDEPAGGCDRDQDDSGD